LYEKKLQINPEGMTALLIASFKNDSPPVRFMHSSDTTGMVKQSTKPSDSQMDTVGEAAWVIIIL
jgi:hypothetical protein